MNSLEDKIKVLTVIPGEETGSSMIFAKRQVDSIDKTKVDSIATLMANHHKELEEFTFQHFQKLRAICRNDQKKLFDETIDQISKMIGEAPPHPGGPPPR